MNLYDKALRRFTISPDKERPIFEEPRPYGDYIIATDTVSLIRIRKDLCEDSYPDYKGNLPNFDRIFPKVDCSSVLQVERLATVIGSIPWSETVKVSGPEAECKECDGSGSVYWEYIDNNGNEHHLDHDCPLCEGRGRFTERTLSRVDRSIAINDVCFNVGYIRDILLTISELGHKSATVRHIAAASAMLINVESGVDILLMPNKSTIPACKIRLNKSHKS